MWKFIMRLILFVFIPCVMADNAHYHSHSTDVIIDKTIWKNFDGRMVKFYSAGPVGEIECKQLDKDFFFRVYSSKETKSLRMGEVCGSLVVVYRDDAFNMAAGELGLEFIAQHESFHLAVQIYGSQIPIEYLRTQRRVAEGRSAEFFKKLTESFFLFDAEKSHLNKDVICGKVFKGYDLLSEDEKREVDGVVFWEWPAEYYAYRKLKRDGSIDYKSYSVIRRLAGSYDEYSPGVSVGLALDGILGSNYWQSRVMKGESMMDVIGAMCSSDYIPLPRTNVRVKKMDFDGN